MPDTEWLSVLAFEIGVCSIIRMRRYLATVALGLFVASLLAAPQRSPSLIYNPSQSAPAGWYVHADNNASLDAYVTLPVPGAARAFARR